MPANSAAHNGGKITIGRDGGLYTIVGDRQKDTILQNNLTGAPGEGTGVIYKLMGKGNPFPNNPFSNSTDGYERYFAYGIRNSFGLTIGPLTGLLWDTENGDLTYDEINVVRLGFNSGWATIMGPIERTNSSVSELVALKNSEYSNPSFSWKYPVGVTDLDFLDSYDLGEKYAHALFVGDIRTGNLYSFSSNKTRTSFDFGNDSSDFIDLVFDPEDQANKIILGSRFGGITDLQTGPEGSLYVLTFSGELYRTYRQ